MCHFVSLDFKPNNFSIVGSVLTRYFCLYSHTLLIITVLLVILMCLFLEVIKSPHAMSLNLISQCQPQKNPKTHIYRRENPRITFNDTNMCPIVWYFFLRQQGHRKISANFFSGFSLKPCYQLVDISAITWCTTSILESDKWIQY